MRRRAALVVGACAMTIRCGGPPDPEAATRARAGGARSEASADQPGAPASLRLALELGDTVTGPLWVQVNAEDGQPAWVRVSGAGGRVHLRSRCEIEDCSDPRGVCGLSPPTVRNVSAAPDRRIEFSWDRTLSVVEEARGCERRVPAEPGAYVAHFCYGRRAAVDATAAPGADVTGRVVDPECVEVPFELADTQVVLRR